MIHAAAAIVIVVLAQSGDSLDPSVKPTGFVRNCLTSGCHAGIADHERMHAPTAAGACLSCHEHADETAHEFRLSGGTDRELCGFCHMAQAVAADSTVHEPVAEGRCLVCHDPHGSAARGLPRTGDIRTQCLECHRGIGAGKAHVHTPVAELPCTVCHAPHSSGHPDLLARDRRTMCLECHADVLNETGSVSPADITDLPRALPAGHDHTSVHGGQIDDCSTCHLTHASDEPSLLRAPVTEVCASCHQGVLDVARSSTVAHSPVTEDRACLHCHAAHGSPVGAFMLDHPTRTCLTCHDKPVLRADGTTVNDVHDMVLAAEHKHGAVSEGRCRGCHEVHGSEHRSLLSHPYTPAFYQRFEVEAYALCFECHSRELVLAESTDSTTRFRDGTHNLHYAHVVATKTPGRTCRACHATHASTSARLLATSVPYGQWEIPISFRATPTGGACGAGCHRARAYDRESPVGAGDAGE